MNESYRPRKEKKEGSEGAEDLHLTKILSLTSDYYGETTSPILVQIDAEFDVKAAKKEFDEIKRNAPSDSEEVSMDNFDQDSFADWLIKKGLAKPIRVISFHEAPNSGE